MAVLMISLTASSESELSPAALNRIITPKPYHNESAKERVINGNSR
jgi:hypothetical protein